MSWLVRTLSTTEGEPSSKRLSLFIATAALAIAEVILAIAALYGRQVDVAISGVSAALAGVGGWAYTNGLQQERKP